MTGDKPGGKPASDGPHARRTFRLRAAALAAGVLLAALPLAGGAGAGRPQPMLRDGQVTPEARAFWSFQPLAATAVPPAGDPAWGGSEIDRFLSARHRAAGLVPVAPAGKRALLRRVTFDLTGLPPAPEEAEAFLADAAPDAYAKVVERLLASPHYGEKWGRHWLDVVRYADTAGETSDFPAQHAWRYRNYVIDAFNRDKPYDQFLREQLAGDVTAQQLPPDAPGYRERYAELITATGYLAVARRFGATEAADHHLTLEDTIDTLGKSVLGLTVGCARCHDHKYDPIPQSDFYALYGIFESTRYAYPGAELVKTPKDMVPLLPPAEIEKETKPYRDALAALDAAVAKAAAGRAGAEGAVLQVLAQARQPLAAGDVPNGGSQAIGPASAAAKGEPAGPVEVKPGQVIQLAVLPKSNYGADSTLIELDIAEIGGEGRTWSLAKDVVPDLHAGNPHADSYGNKAAWWFLDARGGDSAVPLPLATPVSDAYNTPGLKLWRGAEETPMVGANATDKAMAPVTLGLPPKSFFAHPSPAGAVAVAWVSPIAGAVRVSGRLADADAGGGDGVAWSLEHVGAEVGPALLALRDLAAAHAEAVRRKAAHAAAAPKFDVAYAVAEGKPHDAPLQKRGDPKLPGDVVPRRFLQVLGGHAVPAESAAKGSGRAELARWVTDPAQPGGALAARVMANRVWQNHFGRGIVATPSDFGTRGDPPTHPELLEWLARRFVESGWSVKSMHRLVVLSRAYQLASTGHAENARLDPTNSLVWHFPRRRLSAEEIRDNILAVTGDLDRAPGRGHPFPAEGTYAFTQHAPFVAVYETDKRSVYLMTQRIKRHPFLALFDGPDANASTADRHTTTVPPQSLFFMNDPFVHAKAANMAGRLVAASPDDAARLDRAYRLMFARSPEPPEKEAATSFLAAYRADLERGGRPAGERDAAAWSAYVRVLLGTNEFIYVD